MSCASSTTTKSKGAFLLLAIVAASAVNSSACVISLRVFKSARTRSKIDHSSSALRLGQPGLSAEPCDIAIGLPGLQLPGIDDLLPFGEEKVQAELVPADGAAAVFRSASTNVFAVRNLSRHRCATCRAADRCAFSE